MKGGIIFLISVINIISYLGNDIFCEDICPECCEKCCGEECWKKNEEELKSKGNEEEKKENEDEEKSDKVVETFFLEVEGGSEEEAKIFVDKGWLNRKKNNNSNPVLKLFEKKENSNTKNNIKVVKDKDGNLGVEISETLKWILGINTNKWALFEIKYKKEGEEETVYLYCSDIQSVGCFGIFDGKIEFLSISVLDCDTSNVTDMGTMFNICSSLKTLDISKFNTSKVTNMVWMFYKCSSLTTLNISNFNTGEVIYMGCMFEGCSSLTKLDISNFDTSKMKDRSNMFKNCNKLQQITVSDQAKYTILKSLSGLKFEETKNDGIWTLTRKNE